MLALCLLVCTWLSYTVVFSLLASPGIGAFMAAAMFSAVFCGAFALIRALITRAPFQAFLGANAAMLGTWLVIFLISARAGNFTAGFANHPTWISGEPTLLGWLRIGYFTAFCFLNHLIGYGACTLLLSRFPAGVRQSIYR